jgi:outer membrane protein OmpA-like peptidoglycan-associated protein
MALFTALLSTLDKASIATLAGTLGESELSVSRGMQSSIAALLGCLASKADEPGRLRLMLDLVPNTLGGATWSQLAAGVSDPNSALMTSGKRVLADLFGVSASTVTSELSTASGLRPEVMQKLLAVVVPMGMSFLVNRARDEGMSMSGLGSLLKRESSAIRSALPAGLSDLFWQPTAAVGPALPVAAQAVQVEKKRSSLGWLALLALALLVPGLFWLFSHARKPTLVQVSPAPTGTANRVAPDLSDLVKRNLPTNVDLHFDSGTAELQPASQEQLNNVAADLTAHPNVRAKVGGYTDNIGSPEQNLELSQRRANTVMAELIRKGVSPDRLTAQGYGEQRFIADNSTAAGRAQNRRVSVSFTEE